MIIQGDCLTEIKKLPDESVNCCITSPPYNKGYYDKHKPHKTDAWRQRNIHYGGFKDNLNPQDYIKQQSEVLQQMVRLLKPDGSIFYNTKPVIANHKLVYPTFVFDFNVRQQIIWDRGSSPQLAPIRFFPTTEYIFWITKTNIQPKFYRRGKHDKEVWRINAKPMKDHPAPFPEELVANCIVTTTDENDTILDPFCGSGTTGVVAKKLNREFIGIELNPEYIKLAEQRINNAQGSLFNTTKPVEEI
jgi:site-specific DNA-methyltransferase (adenine-specific)